MIISRGLGIKRNQEVKEHFVFGKEALKLLLNKAHYYKENCALLIAQDKARVYEFDYEDVNVVDLLRKFSDYTCFKQIDVKQYKYFKKYQDNTSSEVIISQLKNELLL
tara:strand:- start:739 stop:1062 length:324 start_codon:yes stop_codon:yes gene_type:complete